MFRQPVISASPRKIAAVLTAVALATAGLSARSDAGPSRTTSAIQEGTDVWSGDWLAEGQDTEGGPFYTFGVITFELVGPAEFDVDETCDQGELLYEGSYDYGGGGTVEACAFSPGSLAGEYYSRDYFTSGVWGQFLIEMEGGSWEGVYSPPTDNPLGVPATLKWRGKRAETNACEAPGESQAGSRPSGSGSARTRTARLAETSKELARPDPIEGVWLHCAGEVRVTPVPGRDGSFVGTAVRKMSFPGCTTDYVANADIWDLTGEASTPNSTLYRGTFVCDGANRQATWEVFPKASPTPDAMELCPTDAGSESCTSLIRNEPASRRFRVTLTDGRPNKPMNAVMTDKDGHIIPNHPLYLTTTAELKNAGFRALWGDGSQHFIDFSALTGTLIVEDLYFPGHRDEVTRLKITGFKNGDEYDINPGNDEAGVPPSTFFVVRVEVLSSDWKRCPDGAKGEVHFGWNGRAAGDDGLGLLVCNRIRSYKHQVPDDKSKVDIELIELPPK
jgi:hypothetical protein